MKNVIILLLGLAITGYCSAQKPPPHRSLRDITFKGIMGRQNDKKNGHYSLLGTDIAKTSRSQNADSFITNWLSLHPDAIVIPVSAFGFRRTQMPDFIITYCWLVANRDTLNTYLVRNGCFPAAVMQRGLTPQEMSAKERNSMKPEDFSYVYVDKKSWDAFAGQITDAEKYAADNHLGIWNKP